jgi:hypothetical protein
MAQPKDMTPKQKRLYAEALRQMEGFLDKELAEHLANRIKEFNGNFLILESAIGALIVGQLVGWRPLTLIHSYKTIKRYQEVLDLDFKGKLPWDQDRNVMPEEGVFARKSVAYEVALKINDFWKVFRGEAPGIEKSDKQESQPLPN